MLKFHSYVDSKVSLLTIERLSSIKQKKSRHKTNTSDSEVSLYLARQDLATAKSADFLPISMSFGIPY